MFSLPSDEEIRKIKNLERVSNVKYRSPPDESIHTEIRNMPQRADLLIGLDKVMNRNFFSMKSSDTLADAFCVMSIQNFQEVIIVDDEDKFLGIARRSDILREMPPNLLDVPLELQSRDSDFHIDMGFQVLELSKTQIRNKFNFDRSIHCFQTHESLSSALSDLLRSYNLLPKTIPVLNSDQTLAGIVTYREILQYLTKDSLLRETKASVLIAQHYEYIYTLSVDATLAEASMAIAYLPTNYIWVCSNNQLEGVITRTQLAQLEHFRYLEMFSYPLKHFFKSVEVESLLIDLEHSISEIVEIFLQQETDFLIYADRTKQGFKLKGIITPISIIHFLLSSLRSIN